MRILQSKDVFQTVFELLKRLCGADQVSIVVCSRHDCQELEIFHSAERSFIPEFADIQQAKQFIVNAENKGVHSAPRFKALSGWASQDPHVRLIRILPMKLFETSNESIENLVNRSRRESDQSNLGDYTDRIIWLGLHFIGGNISPDLAQIDATNSGSFNMLPERKAEWIAWVYSLIGVVTVQSHHAVKLLRDPISSLPGRVEFQATLAELYSEAQTKGQPLSLLLINPDDYSLVNQRFGREIGDQTLREISSRIANQLRKTDLLYRFGSAMFIVILPSVGSQQTSAVVEKLKVSLEKEPYVKGAVKLTYSFGIADYVPENQGDELESPGEFVRRVDQALNIAKFSGGGQTVTWYNGISPKKLSGPDRISGMFNADVVKDYRNMQLLWDTVSVVSTSAKEEVIATEFLNRLQSAFNPSRLALYIIDSKDQSSNLIAEKIQVSHSNELDGSHRFRNNVNLELKLLNQARINQQACQGRWIGSSEKSKDQLQCIAHSIPLIARGKTLGCLYMEGLENILGLDTSDIVFLTALTDQVALILDRAELAERAKQKQQIERSELRAEIRELRQAVQQSRLIYQSPEMHTVLMKLRQVAPTDATVLITGESGTGKELLARTVHELSDRVKKPFVVVDCGAIAHTLMERELFGHVKGAFTGAAGSSRGRIVEAEGGTILLDEIAEVPLDLQVKLLRFVQEKEITSVGSTQPRSVDVRIIAATNRNLIHEVEAGRFRQDLYYRLNVISVLSPPLRERPDDIQVLVHYFIDKFSIQYQKGIRRMSVPAEQAVSQYRWPGNVRELQNRILSAVILCQGDEIQLHDLHLGESASGYQNSSEKKPEQEQLMVQSSSNNETFEHRQQAMDHVVFDTENDAWRTLENELGKLVGEMIDREDEVGLPIGRWLNTDVVLIAYEEAGCISRRAAELLEMPETSFRRNLAKAQNRFPQEQRVRPQYWNQLRPYLQLVFQQKETQNLHVSLKAIQTLLIKAIHNSVGDDHRKAAQLLDITPVTYRRRLQSNTPSTKASKMARHN